MDKMEKVKTENNGRVKTKLNTPNKRSHDAGHQASPVASPSPTVQMKSLFNTHETRYQDAGHPGSSSSELLMESLLRRGLMMRSIRLV